MDVGELCHWVMLQKQVTTQSNTGRKLPSYVTVDECWAAIEPMEGEETQQGNKTVSYIPQKITIRYNSKVNAACRFVYVDDDGTTRYYNVISLFSMKERRVWTVTKCREDTSLVYVK